MLEFEKGGLERGGEAGYALGSEVVRLGTAMEGGWREGREDGECTDLDRVASVCGKYI